MQPLLAIPLPPTCVTMGFPIPDFGGSPPTPNSQPLQEHGEQDNIALWVGCSPWAACLTPLLQIKQTRLNREENLFIQDLIIFKCTEDIFQELFWCLFSCAHQLHEAGSFLLGMKQSVGWQEAVVPFERAPGGILHPLDKCLLELSDTCLNTACHLLCIYPASSLQSSHLQGNKDREVPMLPQALRLPFLLGQSEGKRLILHLIAPPAEDHTKV